MKKGLILFFWVSCFLSTYAQSTIKDKLIAQGAWFLFSTRTEEHFDNDKNTLTQIDFFKKSDVSSIFFDNDDKLYSVFSKDGSDMLEDLWRLVDDTHFVIVSPVDESPQLMDIFQLDSNRLVIGNCVDIDNGTRCITYTYFSSKEGWLPDQEINELNTAGIIDLDEAGNIVENE